MALFSLLSVKPLSSSITRTISTSSSLFVYKEPFSFDDRYLGGFDYHDRNKYPRRMSTTKEEDLLDEVHEIRNKEITPSPFHIIRRIRSMSKLPWQQKITLRRLNIHSSSNGDVAIVPNTPQFNSLIYKVKHLIQLKPVEFKDGKIPSPEDIGALKICPYTGTVEVDEKLRRQHQRLNQEKPVLFQGNHLRGKINRLYGLSNNHYMK